jgi:hypothetical protein
MNRIDLNNKVAGLFNEETISSLKKFSNYIDSQKPDIIVLIARKAICLFDLFSHLGINRPQGEIVSDRVLDLEVEYFRDKKVMVIDDTLILGTTLKSIKEKLTNNNVDFQIAVFCVDKDNWQKELIIPDYIENYYTSQKLLDFCIVLVRAFSLVSIPYLIDFPITNLNHLTRKEFEKISNHEDLKSVKLSVNYNGNNELYTFLLDKNIKSKFYEKIGESFKIIIDVVKIRAFVSIIDETNLRIRLVPIVLLHDISGGTINEIFQKIISCSEKEESFQKLLVKPEIRLRFIQYYLSVSLGKNFIENIANSGLQNHFIFKCSESINLFGKKVSKDYEELLQSDGVPPLSFYADQNKTIICENSFDDIFEDIQVNGFNVLKSFQEIFVNLFNKRELPAREELKCGNFNTHLKNRLNNGISFNKIVNYFCDSIYKTSEEKIIPTDSIKEVFSICLDVCNDLGLSIPIICNSNGIYYRAFRHGELGKRTKGNIFLFHKYLEAFCESNGYDYSNGFDSVLLEKLAVLFYRVGAKNRFIDVTDDYSDPTAINIGFYLMGAILIENDPNEYFPNKHKDWFLSSHCGNLFRTKQFDSRYRYYFNIIPQKEGANTKEGAELKAKLIGNTLGKAIKLSKKEIPENPEVNGFPLDLDRLTILATCYTAGDLSMALAAELNIYYNWLKQISEKSKKYKSIIDSSYLADFQSSTVFKAFNQVFFKFSYSLSDEKNIEKIIAQTKKYLGSDPICRDIWSEYATKLNIGQDDLLNLNEMSPKVVKSILEIASFMFKIGNIMHLIRYALEVYDNINKPTIKINSQFEFEDLKTGRVSKRTIVEKFKKETSLNYGNEIGYLTTPGKSFRGHSIGDKVSFTYEKINYNFRIIKISNYNIRFDSIIVFEDFNRNLDEIFKSYSFLKDKSNLLPDNYKQIIVRMKDIRNCRDKNRLNDLLLDILSELSKDQLYIEMLLDNVKNNYSNSRDNLVSLLM